MLSGIVGFFVGLLGLLSAFLFGKETQKKEVEINEMKSNEENNNKRKAIENEIAKNTLKSLVDTNNAYLNGKREDLK